MRQSVRLLFNVGVMFGRNALTFGIGLYGTRLLVNLLGHSDFGLMAAVGASGGLMLFIGYSLSSGAQRTVAHELGRGDPERLSEVFNSTLALFVALSLVLLLLGFALQSVIVGALQIPEGRESAVSSAYLFTVLFLTVTVLMSPFNAVLEARQAMGQIAALETFRSILNLGAVLLLFVTPWDRLVTYAGMQLAVGLTRVLAVVALATYQFPESRPHPSRIRSVEMQRITSFAGWATLLGLGGLIYNQASILLLGIAATPVVTAAYAIAIRVAGYHRNFAGVVPRVVQPAMTTLEARGERGDVKSLALMTGKYATLAILFPVVPLLLEADTILELWLASVPEGSALFVQIVIAAATFRALTAGYDQAAISHGNLAPYAIATTTLWLIGLVGAGFGLLVLDLPVWTLPAMLFVMALIQTPLRLVIVGRLIDLPWTQWLRESAVPTLVPAAIGTGIALVAHANLTPGAHRVLAVTAAYAVGAAPAIWLFAVGPREKRAIREMFHRALRRS